MSVSVLSDMRTLVQMLRGMPASTDTGERLERFYAPQAASYDRFRSRLLHGREDLIASLVLPPGAHVVELGAGTGSNLERYGDRLNGFASVHLVDLCQSLLAEARSRARRYPNVQVVEADACEFRPPVMADCVIFSYSLTMIPEWREALLNAIAMLRPGGQLAIVDFAPPGSNASLGDRLWRGFWRQWFAHDGVHLDDGHLTSLERLLPQHHLIVRNAVVPYLPGLKMPYYRFVGVKPRDTSVM